MKHSSDGVHAVKNMDSPDNILDAQRREKVKDAMLHAWSSYEKYAWGHDELQVWMLLLISYLCNVAFLLLHIAILPDYCCRQ